jgi:hypothetical protein
VIDLTGDWTFSIAGDASMMCSAEIEQVEEAVSGTFHCPQQYTGTFEGTIVHEPVGATLDAMVTFHAQGQPVDVWAMIGDVSPNGNRFSGDWQSQYLGSGTFTGERPVAVYTHGDLNCDTHVRALDALTAIRFSIDADVFQYPDCPAIGVEFASLFGDADCDGHVDQADALRILRYAGGLPVPAVTDCPDIGAQISEPL